VKSHLHRYLRTAREAVLWKLEGLSPYDLRRPLTPTGTNLLGLVKHLAAMEVGYFADTFDRPFGERFAWMSEDAETNADMWATVDESVEDVVGLYRRACEHADATIDALDLDSTGVVPWWSPERRDVTLHLVLIHMIAETDRHAGHADIVRELVDGAAGLRPDNDNLGQVDWETYRAKLEAVARGARD